jgi:hypothetical protein
LRPTGAIWVEKSARLRNLISLVIFPEGLKFSATSRREISESSCHYFLWGLPPLFFT